MLDWLADRVVLFEVGDLLFVTFGLFASVGAFLTLTWMGVLLVGQGIAVEAFLAMALAASTLVVLGSWLLAQILDFRLVLRAPAQALRRPVFVSWGGLLVLPPLFFLFSWLSGNGVLVFVDAFALSMPIGHALGRLGCLSYGCCFGRPTRGPLAITYRSHMAKAVRVGELRNVRLHPTALYEAVLDLGILVVVTAAALLQAPVGLPSALALMLYGFGRFGIEFLKDNQGRMLRSGWSVNHLLSLAMAALGVLVLRSVLLGAEATPVVAWSPALDVVPTLLPALIPSAIVVFLGFSLHRRRVGSW
jgi:phosphatidylglycerol:prolipoprotein diacylglycerol transferase